MKNRINDRASSSFLQSVVNTNQTKSVRPPKDSHKYVASDKECCINCYYFEKDTGFCRVNPPQVVVQGMYYNTKFPIPELPQKDYCGEFAFKNQ